MAEAGVIGPEGIYGLSKLFGEKLVQQYGQDYKIVRLFNTYGENDPHPHLIPRIFEQYRQGRKIELGNPESVRDYIHVKDAAAAFISVLLKGKNHEVYNIGTGSSHSVRDVVDICAKLLSEDTEVKFVNKNMRAHDTPLLRADITKISADTGWQPQVQLADGLAATASRLFILSM